MLVIESRVLSEVIGHVLNEHPFEACGIIAGKDSPSRVVRMDNAEKSATKFRFEPRQQLKVWTEMELRGEDLHIVWHSHIGCPPIPSKADIKFGVTAGKDVIHLIVSIMSPATQEADIRAWRYHEDGTFTEVEIAVQEELEFVG